jgi:hypothetical protein
MYVQKAIKQNNLEEKNCFFGVLKVKDENSRIHRSRAGSGSIAQRHGSADPDPYQNVTDPQHRYKARALSHINRFTDNCSNFLRTTIAFALVSTFLYELCIILRTCMSSFVYFSNFLGFNVQSG